MSRSWRKSRRVELLVRFRGEARVRNCPGLLDHPAAALGAGEDVDLEDLREQVGPGDALTR